MKLTKLVRRFFFFVSALLLTLTLSITDINAQTTPFLWEFINVDIAVQNNGDMLITETQKYTFTSDYNNQRSRNIPLDKVKEITDISVSKNDEIIPSDTKIVNNQLSIRWQHPLNPPESHTFVIKYRVVGGLQESDSNLQVYWKAIFPQRSSPIQKSRVTVTFPKELAGKILEFKSFGVPTQTRKIDDKTIEFIAQTALGLKGELEVEIIFPKEIISVSDVYSQSSSFQPSTIQIFGWIFMIIFALFLLILLIISFFRTSNNAIGSDFYDNGVGVSNSFDGGGSDAAGGGYGD